jgi:hypothetical protein
MASVMDHDPSQPEIQVKRQEYGTARIYLRPALLRAETTAEWPDMRKSASDFAAHLLASCKLSHGPG